MKNTMRVMWTYKSRNGKTGAIGVSTSPSKTCPKICPFRKAGCYSDGGPINLHWTKLDKEECGVSWEEFCGEIERQAAKRVWRHNQAGDLPGDGDLIELEMLEMLVNANRGKRGFTYTHYDVSVAHNAQAVKNANDNGFTINLSGNNPAHADQLVKLGIGPVVSVVPIDYPAEGGATPDGHKIVVCPAQTRDDVTCATCKLCTHAHRNVIIGFRAHGTRAKLAEKTSAAA